MSESKDGSFLGTATKLLPLAGEIFGGISQGIQNRKQRKWNEKMYERQRSDAIADWERQNEYNSPQAQMQRLKDAGLNPNLAYGTGVSGNSAGQPRAASAPAWSPKAPSFDGGSVLGQIYNTELQKAQIELVRQNTEVRKKEADLKDADLIAKLVKNSSLNLAWKKETELYDTSIEFAKARLKNMVQDTEKKGAETNLTEGKSYYQSQQNRLIDKNFNELVTIYEQKVRQGELDIRKAVEQILTIQAERSKIPVEINRLNAIIAEINSGTDLKKVQKELAEFDLATGKNMLKDMILRLMGTRK